MTLPAIRSGGALMTLGPGQHLAAARLDETSASAGNAPDGMTSRNIRHWFNPGLSGRSRLLAWRASSTSTARHGWGSRLWPTGTPITTRERYA